ncbi:MAG: peptidase M15 [Acidobacteria bacterium]|nr:MAG: peptidase M15 [Acidobacteriota bacterium]PIE89739.1 MAG: peptidase M15 [Acidobacteriota bacterium]
MRKSLFILLPLILSPSMSSDTLPDGFIYLDEVIPGISIDLKYFGTNNFVGKKINGYEDNKCILSIPAAEALKGVQRELAPFGLELKILDAYRPQQAVNHFIEWAKDLTDTQTKQQYYPHVPKNRLFAEGYIASRSGHSKGSTVDLTLIDSKTGEELDMGSPFDFFGPVSWVQDTSIHAEQRSNRMLLNLLMTKYGFKAYRKEWWHFTLKNEPFPSTFFNFPVR